MSLNKLSLWVHLVWGIKKNSGLITEDVKTVLFEKIEEIASAKGYDIVEMNAMPDHIHILIRLNPMHSISKMVKNIKGITAHFINQQGIGESTFEWQQGYGAFTVSSFMVQKVINYIKNQQKHHADKDFEDEMSYLDIMGKEYD